MPLKRIERYQVALRLPLNKAKERKCAATSPPNSLCLAFKFARLLRNMAISWMARTEACLRRRLDASAAEVHRNDECKLASTVQSESCLLANAAIVSFL